MTDIHTIRLGATNTYLIGGSCGWLLVDTGIRSKADLFFRHLDQRGITPEQIRLLVVTHGHFDHVGTVSAIRARCRCPVAIHAADAPLLEAARIVIPPGISPMGRFFSRLGRRHPHLVDRLYRFTAVPADIVLTGETSLAERGFAARIVPTPGHTPGSVSVITENGDAFVGDLAFNVLAFSGRPPLPPFAEDRNTLCASWQKLRDLGVQRIWPAHGFPFAADRLTF